MRRALAAMLSFALVLVGAYAVLVREEVKVAEYASFAEAQRSGAVERGWIPEYMPASAVKIREAHDLDTNEQWLRFEISATDAATMVGRMERITYSAVPREGTPPRWEGSWLPEPAQDLEMSPGANLRYYFDPSPGLGARCVAVHGERIVYAWSCPPPGA